MKNGAEKITVVIMILFFAAMMVLTFKAGDIHDSMLPQVTTTRAVSVEYTRTVTTASGHTREVKANGRAVPENAYRDGRIFVVVTQELYGRESSFARAVEVEIADEKEGLVILKGDSIGNRKVIVECTEELYDMMEVYLNN